MINTKLNLLNNNKVPPSFTTNLQEKYDWIWLPSADVTQLLNMRNAEHVLSNMRNPSRITQEAHLEFLQKYNDLQRVDFILIHNSSGEYVGSMNISLTGYGFEIGKYIGNVNYLGRGISHPMSMSFIQYLKDNLSEITKICSVTRLNNYKNINLNFKLGFRIISLVEERYWLMELV